MKFKMRVIDWLFLAAILANGYFITQLVELQGMTLGVVRGITEILDPIVKERYSKSYYLKSLGEGEEEWRIESTHKDLSECEEAMDKFFLARLKKCEPMIEGEQR